MENLANATGLLRMLIMSCYTGFFNLRRGWQSLNTGPVLFTSHPKDGLVVNLYIKHNRRMPLQAEEAPSPILSF